MSNAKKTSTTRKRREKAYLEQIGGQGVGRTFELSRELLSIGRTEDNEIVMKSESVSRCHAYIKRGISGYGWSFQDNGSKNGIKVNGQKVADAKLQDGDLLVVGDFTFRFHDAEPEFVAASEVVPTHQEKTSPSMDVPLDIAPPRSRRVHPPPKADYGTFFMNIVVPFLERHSWLAGLVVGMVIGGGLWWKSSRTGLRPGAVAAIETPAPVPAPPPRIPPVRPPPPAPQPSEPRTVAAEKPEPPKPVVTRADLNVAPKQKKPKSDIRDLKVYLREGRDYLKEGDKESAAIAYRFALVLDPRNKEAMDGLRAAGVKVDVPSSKPRTPAAAAEEKRPNTDAKKKAKVVELMKAAVDAFGRRSYQEAIDKADAARKIEIAGQTEYLNEAKQIIDRAKAKQKEDFEPFLESALKKIEEGDFKGSAALCEEMLRTDPAYAPARECLAKSLDGIAGRRAQ